MVGDGRWVAGSLEWAGNNKIILEESYVQKWVWLFSFK